MLRGYLFGLLRVLWVLWAAFAAFALPSDAQAQGCTGASDVTLAELGLIRMLDANARLDRQSRDYLDRAARSHNAPETSARLDTLGLDTLEPRLDAFFARLNRLLARGQASPSEVTALLSDAGTMRRIICSHAAHSVGGSSTPASGAQEDAPPHAGAAHARQLRSLALVVLATLGSVALVLLTRETYARVYARIYHRTACRIRATVSRGDRKLFGYVTILGRRGARFEAEFETDRTVLNAWDAKDDIVLQIGDETLEVLLTNIADTRAALFFDGLLPLGTHRAWLAKSLIATRAVKMEQSAKRPRPQASST